MPPDDSIFEVRNAFPITDTRYGSKVGFHSSKSAERAGVRRSGEIVDGKRGRFTELIPGEPEGMPGRGDALYRSWQCPPPCLSVRVGESINDKVPGRANRPMKIRGGVDEDQVPNRTTE